MTDNQPDNPTMVMFLAYSIACHVIAKNTNKTPRDISFELSTIAEFVIESNKLSPEKLDAFMQSVMPEQET